MIRVLIERHIAEGLEKHYNQFPQGPKPFIQYTVINGVNDDKETALKLLEQARVP